MAWGNVWSLWMQGKHNKGPTTIKGEIGRDNAQPGKKEKKNKTDMEKEPMMRKGATADTGMAGENSTRKKNMVKAGRTWLRKGENGSDRA